jgi:hypothetical protein
MMQPNRQFPDLAVPQNDGRKILDRLLGEGMTAQHRVHQEYILKAQDHQSNFLDN